MTDSSNTCPHCHSNNIRRSRRQSGGEFIKMTLGSYPFRCLACNARFWRSIWLLSIWRYAKCPKCLGLVLTTWPRRNYHLTFWSKLMLTMGARRHRCSACRHNFVGFRPRSPFNTVAGAADTTQEPAAVLHEP